jgi:hypothetical protein
MANAIYPLWKQEIMKGTANNVLNGAEGATAGVFAALVTSAYTYSAAHQFYSSLAGITGTPQEILSKTQVTGIFDGTDIIFPSVAGGSTCNAVVLYRSNGGANTTWPLIAYLDTNITNLPVTTNGGNVAITWNASGILAL